MPGLTRSLFTAGLFLAFLLPANAAPPSSAITNLNAYGRARGPQDLSRVVGVVGFYGQSQPPRWMILSMDPKVPGLMHEFVMQNSRIVAERHFPRPKEQDLPHIPLPVRSLRIDSPQAFKIAEQTAQRAGLGFDSLHYQLRCRDLRNEPIWVLNLNDQKKTPVGVLYISAVTGEVLRSIWNRPGTQQYTQVEDRPGFFEKMNDGFKSFGDKLFKKKQVPPSAAAPPQAAVSTQGAVPPPQRITPPPAPSYLPPPPPGR